jgi:hypothetical protein
MVVVAMDVSYLGVTGGVGGMGAMWMAWLWHGIAWYCVAWRGFFFSPSLQDQDQDGRRGIRGAGEGMGWGCAEEKGGGGGEVAGDIVGERP